MTAKSSKTGKAKKPAKPAKLAAQAPKAKEKAVALPETTAAASSRFPRLQRLNKWLGIAYAVEVLAILIVAVGKSYPVAIHYQAYDNFASAAGKGTVFAPASHVLFSLPLVQLLAMLLAISAAFHLLASGMARSLYEDAVASAENTLRWTENAFSASLLPIAIGLVAGVQDIAILAMLFVLGFVTHILGWQLEHERANGSELGVRRSVVLFSVTGLAAWLALGSYLLGGMVFGTGVAVMLGVAYAIGFVGALAYAWVVLQHANVFGRGPGRWRDYAVVDGSLSLLSFILKSAIVWLLFASALR